MNPFTESSVRGANDPTSAAAAPLTHVIHSAQRRDRRKRTNPLNRKWLLDRDKQREREITVLSSGQSTAALHNK